MKIISKGALRDMSDLQLQEKLKELRATLWEEYAILHSPHMLKQRANTLKKNVNTSAYRELRKAIARVKGQLNARGVKEVESNG